MLPTSSPRRWWFGLLVCLAGATQPLGAGAVRAGPVRDGFTAGSLPPSDDGSSGAVPLGFTANFFGQNYGQVFVNTNGNITFGSALSNFTPVNFAATQHAIVAPFFGDVDTFGGGSVTYGTGMVNGHAAFAATWNDVGYYNAHGDKRNDFQVVLIDRGDTGAGNFDVEFNYNKIQWESGDQSGGVGGLGGSSARVGWSAGTGANGTSFELPGSGVSGSFLDSGSPSTSLVQNSLNSDVSGRYVFSARDGQLGADGTPSGGGGNGGGDPGPTGPPPVSGPPGVPEPGTLLLCAAGLAAVGVCRRRGK